MEIFFGFHAQMAVGVIMILLTVIQWWYWGWFEKPSTTAVFHVSMEALAFAAYAVFANGITLRKAQHVEAQVVNNIDHADKVDVDTVEIENG